MNWWQLVVLKWLSLCVSWVLSNWNKIWNWVEFVFKNFIRSIEIHLEIYNMIQNKTSGSEINDQNEFWDDWLIMFHISVFCKEFLKENKYLLSMAHSNARHSGHLSLSHMEVILLSPSMTSCHLNIHIPSFLCIEGYLISSFHQFNSILS